MKLNSEIVCASVGGSDGLESNERESEHVLVVVAVRLDCAG